MITRIPPRGCLQRPTGDTEPLFWYVHKGNVPEVRICEIVGEVEVLSQGRRMARVYCGEALPSAAKRNVPGGPAADWDGRRIMVSRD